MGNKITTSLLRPLLVDKLYILSEVLISFEAWAKLAKKWLICASLGIHLEPINKDLMLLVKI